MPKRTAAEKAVRKELLLQKRAAKQLAKKNKEQKAGGGKQQKPSSQATNDNNIQNNKNNKHSLTPSNNHNMSSSAPASPLLRLPEDTFHQILSYLASSDLGRVTLTCKQLNHMIPNVRGPYILSRLSRPFRPMKGAVGFIDMCSNEEEARVIIEQSNQGGNSKCPLISKEKKGNGGANAFVSYARFLEEAVNGYAMVGFNLKSPEFLPSFCQGRFVSVSPEHSLCRVGGDGRKCGAGGSGVASWGVGKRGQLGHGKRGDEKYPRRLMGGLGYGIRIVQVSAGGGLVRVAHSLLLTATGKVLSYGTGQYGALGHGYSPGKQLPDVLRPQYIEALSGFKCVCVSAGELHSAVVTIDGDVYTWGDGFCGQLGHGDKRPQLSPKQVTHGGLDDECVASVSCGSRHTLAVTEDGEVFSWGLGHFGVLGRSFTPFVYDADADAGVVEGPTTTAREEGGEDPVIAPPPIVLAQAVNDNRSQGEEVTTTTVANNGDDLMTHLELISNLTLDDSSNQCIPMIIDSLVGVQIVGASAGHRHSLVLDENGGLYSFGAGNSGCLGYGDFLSQMHPVRVTKFGKQNKNDNPVRIRQMSAGVDISMAVSTTGDVYAWGKTDQGRIGLGLAKRNVNFPQPVLIRTAGTRETLKAVDVECGYVHSIIVALNGTIHVCGNVGTDGDDDGLVEEEDDESGKGETTGKPNQMPDFNIWHRLPEPTALIKTERWKKYGKYEVQGRAKMMAEP